jgi:hypothetical protein
VRHEPDRFLVSAIFAASPALAWPRFVASRNKVGVLRRQRDSLLRFTPVWLADGLLVRVAPLPEM